MARWCTLHGSHPTDEMIELIAFAQTREYAKRVTSLYAKYPTDEFVELIAFAQTREYAKRVTALYARYRYLYGPKPYQIPLTLNLKVSPQGPDY